MTTNETNAQTTCKKCMKQLASNEQANIVKGMGTNAQAKAIHGRNYNKRYKCASKVQTRHEITYNKRARNYCERDENNEQEKQTWEK